MPSSRHEALVEILRQQPGFAVQLLTEIVGFTVPVHDAITAGSPDLSETVPAEQRADFVVTVHDAGKPVLGVIVEVQTAVDPDKHYSWPAYVTSLRTRLRCPAILLVICTTDRTSRWASRPIAIGGGSLINPIVVGPASIPAITDSVRARARPELALLSAITHPGNQHVLHALLTTFTADIDHSPLYSELARILLPAAARHYLEHLMTGTAWIYEHENVSDFARKHYSEGKAEGQAEGQSEGKAEAILTVLAARGITVPEDAHARVLSCTDSAQLTTWLTNAVNASNIDDIFKQ